MQWFCRLMVGLSLLLGAAYSYALPIVSIDADPRTSGIQSDFEIAIGNPLTIDVVIRGVEAAALLDAFEFGLDFPPAILSAISVTYGGFLLAPVFDGEGR